jgi:Ser/Thr protein kinase RdoA (MazF antagonist)
MKLSPDDQFIPNEENVAYVLRHYGLELTAYQEASSGIENRTLIVDTRSGKYVMRIYRHGKKKLGAIKLELDFVNYLRMHNIKTPDIIANREGERVTTERLHGKTWQIIVMEFAEGEHAQKYTEALLQDLAEIQAKMHNLSSQYNGELIDATNVTALQGRQLVEAISGKTIQDGRLLAFLQRAGDYVVELPSDLPKGLCHLDYDKDNTLVKNGVVSAVLDFDDLAIAPFVVCLAYALWDVYVEAGEKSMKDYLTQYEKLRKLSEAERRYIKSAMLFRHYFVTTIKILYGHTSPDEISQYINIEDTLRQPNVRPRQVEP